MEIIRCKICEKPFFPLVNYEDYTSSNSMYDYGACDECNKKALDNSVKKS